MGGRPKPRPQLSVVSSAHRSNAEKADRAANTPKGCADKLAAPKDLSPAARREWTRVVKLYRQLEVPILNDLDRNLLAAYCSACAIFHEAQLQLQQEELVIYSPQGEPKPNPLLKIIEKQGLLLAKYVEQLCLSPVGRAQYAYEATKAKQKAAQKDQPPSMAGFLQRAGR